MQTDDARSSTANGFEGLARLWEASLQPNALKGLAVSLGLTAESLRRLSVGWSAGRAAYTFPMRDAGDLVVGSRLRQLDGQKLSVTGGREGLFIPEGLPAGGRLCVTEGPTDCAALLEAGLAAVGWPSCSGGVKAITALVTRLLPDVLTIVSDGDNPGLFGGERPAAPQAAFAPTVRFLTPPAEIKDARAWLNAGAPQLDIQAAIEAASVRRLCITWAERGDS